YNEGTQELATNMIRNELFRQTVYNPFLLLNYGTTDKEEIQKIYDKVDGAEEIPKGNDGTYLLSKDFTELKADQKKDKIEALSKENTYMTVDKVGYKFIMSLISVLGTIFYGVPITAIAFLNVLLQLMAIVYSYILPIVAILSVFPKFSNGFTSSLINIAKIFIGKGLLGLVVLMFSLTNLTIDLLIAPSGFVTALLNLGVKITIYILVWKNRGKIVETITRAMVMQKTGVYLPQMVNRTSNQQQTAPYPYPMTNQAQDFVEERTIQESVSQEPHHMDYYEPTPHSEANDEEAKATKAAVSETIPIDELPVEDTPNELPVEEPLYEIPIKDISFENMPTEELPVEDFSDHVSMEEPPLGEFSVEETDIESLEMNEPPTIEHELTEKHVNETSEKTNDQQITNEPRQPVVNFSQQEIQNPTMNFYQENQIEEKLIQQEDFHDRLAELRG
ncbi:CD3337/EF1877 family mobilome membrane protein, partial [Enterococcus faecalis]